MTKMKKCGCLIIFHESPSGGSSTSCVVDSTHGEERPCNSPPSYIVSISPSAGKDVLSKRTSLPRNGIKGGAHLGYIANL